MYIQIAEEFFEYKVYKSFRKSEFQIFRKVGDFEKQSTSNDKMFRTLGTREAKKTNVEDTENRQNRKQKTINTKNQKTQNTTKHKQYVGILGGEMWKIPQVPKYCFLVCFCFLHFPHFTYTNSNIMLCFCFLVFSTFHLQWFENVFFGFCEGAIQETLPKTLEKRTPMTACFVCIHTCICFYRPIHGSTRVHVFARSLGLECRILLPGT